MLVISNLKLGSGCPWAGQCSAILLPIERLKESDLSSVENFGILLPMGSDIEKERMKIVTFVSKNKSICLNAGFCDVVCTRHGLKKGSI